MGEDSAAVRSLRLGGERRASAILRRGRCGALFPLTMGVVLGCSGGGRTADSGVQVQPRGEATLGGSVVSTVDGHAITREDLEHGATLAPGVPTGELLERMQDEALLALAARRAGYGEHPAVHRAVRRAMVQRLLRDEVEAQVTAEQVDEAAVVAEYEATAARFDQPERRRSVYLLVTLPEGAGQEAEAAADAWLESRLEVLRLTRDPVSELLSSQRWIPPNAPFLVAPPEHVAPLAPGDPADPDYLEALFSTDESGVVPRIVRTRLGRQLVVVVAIEPSLRLSRDEGLSRVRAAHLARLRAARLSAFEQSVLQTTPIAFDPARASELLAPISVGAQQP